MSLNVVRTNICQQTGFCDWHLFFDVCVDCDNRLWKVEDRSSQPKGVEVRGELHVKCGEDDDQCEWRLLGSSLVEDNSLMRCTLPVGRNAKPERWEELHFGNKHGWDDLVVETRAQYKGACRL